MVRKLIVPIDDELEKEMRAHPEVDWIEVAIKAIRDCIRDRENCKFYHTIIDRAMSQDRKRRSKSPKKSRENRAHIFPNEVRDILDFSHNGQDLYDKI